MPEKPSLRSAPVSIVVFEEPLLVEGRTPPDSPVPADRSGPAVENPFVVEWVHAPSSDAVAEGRAVLRAGQRGAAVIELQEALNLHYPGDEPLATDGFFGPKTQSRLRDFQAHHGLKVDGIVGTETSGALEAMTARDLLLDDRFLRLPESTRADVLGRLDETTGAERRHLLRLIRSDAFSALAPAAQHNLLGWRPLEGRIVLGV